MRREVVLDPTSGLPRIEPARDDDGRLGFYMLLRRPGGMVVLDPVPDDILRQVPRPDENEVREIHSQVVEVTQVVARQISEADKARAAEMDELRAQVEEGAEALEDAHAHISELERELEQLRKPNMAVEPKPRTARAKVA